MISISLAIVLSVLQFTVSDYPFGTFNLFLGIYFFGLKFLPFKRGSIHMKFSMTGQEKCDLLIQETA
jgi:hypothetical protein